MTLSLPGENEIAGGRPTSLTPEIQAEIVNHLSVGLPIENACILAGIAKQTYYDWKKRGQAETGSIFHEFLDAIKRADCKFMRECLEAVRDALPGWQSKCWLLERKWPELWSSDRELANQLKAFLREQRQKAAKKAKRDA